MKRTSIRKVSKKRAKENRAYTKLRKEFLSEAPFCEIPNCVNRSTEIHHIRGREGLKLLDRTYFLAVCREHHTWIHDHPNRSRQRGLLQ